MTSQPIRVLAITSGKGGVGKTHTTINLGLALVNLGHRVLLLDADLGLANIHVLLGFEPKANIAQVLEGKAQLRDVIVHHPSGLDIIPASSGLPQLTALSEESRRQLIHAVDAFADDYDFLLVDTAAGIGDNVLYFNLAAESVLVVVNHQPTSITDAYALIKVLATQHGMKEFHIVVNSVPKGTDPRTTYAQLATVADRFLNVRLKFLGGIAEDRCVIDATLQQQPYLHLFPSSAPSLDIAKVAKRIADDESPRELRGGLQFFFEQLLVEPASLQKGSLSK